MAYNKFLDAGGDIPLGELKKLANFIKIESKDRLQWTCGILCQLDESGGEFVEGHRGVQGILFGDNVKEGAKAIKGFYFSFYLKKTNFECVVLDPGRSRQYFDEKNKNEKRQYVERFANRSVNRRRSSLTFFGSSKDLEKLPLGFTAFLTDTGDKLVIEEIVGYRSVDNLRFR